MRRTSPLHTKTKTRKFSILRSSAYILYLLWVVMWCLLSLIYFQKLKKSHIFQKGWMRLNQASYMYFPLPQKSYHIIWKTRKDDPKKMKRKLFVKMRGSQDSHTCLTIFFRYFFYSLKVKYILYCLLSEAVLFS